MTEKGQKPRPPGLLDEAVREVVADLSDTAKLRRLQAAAALGRAWHERPPVARALAAAFLLSATIAGLAGVVAPLLGARRLPAPGDWAAVRALLERDARPGDAIAVAPTWAERAREALPASVPVLESVRLAGEDLPGVRRVWLLTLPGAPGAVPGPAPDLATRAAPGGTVRRLGGLEIRRFDLADPMLPLVFLPDRLASLSVKLGGAPCPAEAGGFRCASGANEVWIERTLRDVGGAARPCLAISPGGPLPAPLLLAFSGVTFGRALRFHAGVAGGGPVGRVGLSVLVDGEAAGAGEVEPRGFAPLGIETGRFAGRTGELAVALTAAGPVGDLCLDGMVLP